MARPTGVGRATRGPEAPESSSAKGRQVSNERSDIREELDVASLIVGSFSNLDDTEAG
jgi:hypothetical protein